MQFCDEISDLRHSRKFENVKGSKSNSPAGCQSGAGHSLAQAAVLKEILFQAFELLVDQVIGHFD
jgi:hypothetical protein